MGCQLMTSQDYHVLYHLEASGLIKQWSISFRTKMMFSSTCKHTELASKIKHCFSHSQGLRIQNQEMETRPLLTIKLLTDTDYDFRLFLDQSSFTKRKNASTRRHDSNSFEIKLRLLLRHFGLLTSQNQQTKRVTVLKGTLTLDAEKKPSFCSIKEIRNGMLTMYGILWCLLVLPSPAIKGNGKLPNSSRAISMAQNHQ